MEEEQIVIAPWADADSAWFVVEASSPAALVREVRGVVEAGVPPHTILVRPDALAATDPDRWIALVSVLVAEGIGAIETGEVRSARRLLHTQDAILLGGEERS